MASDDWGPATGDRRLATGDWRPATGDWRPATGDRRLATGDRSERGSDREFRRFLCIAQASNAEVEAQATIAGDLGCIAPTTSAQLIKQSQIVGRMIGRFIATLDASG